MAALRARCTPAQPEAIYAYLAETIAHADSAASVDRTKAVERDHGLANHRCVRRRRATGRAGDTLRLVGQFDTGQLAAYRPGRRMAYRFAGRLPVGGPPTRPGAWTTCRT